MASARKRPPITGRCSRPPPRCEIGDEVRDLRGRREQHPVPLDPARGEHEQAERHLREAARVEDSLVYGEPPEWTVPVRQDLAAILLAAGRQAEAEAAYREDLERFPRNVWSMRGVGEG